MLHRQKQRPACCQPFGSVVIAALGAASILAGVVAVAIFVTRLAAITAATERFGAAAHDIAHGALVTGQHVCAVLRPVRLAAGAEDVGHLRHCGTPDLQDVRSRPSARGGP